MSLVPRLLSRLEKGSPGAQAVVLFLDQSDPPRWRAVWSSNDEFQDLVSHQDLHSQWRPLELASFQAVRLEPQSSRLALALRSTEDWEPQTLEAYQKESTLGLYEGREMAWKQACLGLLTLLAKQRVAIGHALHRGPAQGLTAARLEFSLVEPDILPHLGPLQLAVEEAGERLREIVHEKLASPIQGQDGPFAEEDPGKLMGTLEQEVLAWESWLNPHRGSRVPVGDGLEPKPGARDSTQALFTQDGALASLWTLVGGLALPREEQGFDLIEP